MSSCCGRASGTATRTATGLELYNCCFSSELLRRELAWTREDPLLGYLLWTGPYSAPRPRHADHPLDHASARRLQWPTWTHWPRCATSPLPGTGATSRPAVPAVQPARPGGRRRATPLPTAGRARASGGRPGDADARGRLAHRWTLTELAEELHLAPGYLVRLFKAATGLPPMAYLAQLRAEHAAVLLLHSDEPVTGIGRAVGWPDQNYFARRFKAHYGLSATTYRESFAGWAFRLRSAAALLDGASEAARPPAASQEPPRGLAAESPATI